MWVKLKRGKQSLRMSPVCSLSLNRNLCCQTWGGVLQHCLQHMLGFAGGLDMHRLQRLKATSSEGLVVVLPAWSLSTVLSLADLPVAYGMDSKAQML